MDGATRTRGADATPPYVGPSPSDTPLRALVLAASLAAPTALAQVGPTDAWLSVSGGLAVAQQAGPDNDLYGSAAVQVARAPWAARVGYSELDRLRFDFSGAFSFARAEGSAPDVEDAVFDPDLYRSLTVTTGSASLTDRLAGALLVGPSLTWGPDRSDDWRTYTRLGVAVVGQGAVRVVGPLWLGVETTAVVNGEASHAGAGGVLRVDLARPPR